MFPPVSLLFRDVCDPYVFIKISNFYFTSCNSEEVDNEIHFVTEYFHNQLLRSQCYATVSRLSVNFNTLTNSDKFSFLLQATCTYR